MPRRGTVTVDGGIVSVDGERHLLVGARLGLDGVALPQTAVERSVRALADIGGNAVIVDAATATSAVLDIIDDAGLLAIVDRSAGAPPRSSDVAGHPAFAAWLEHRGPLAPPRRRNASDGPVLGTPRPRRLGWTRGDERDLPDSLRRSLRPAAALLGFGAPSIAAVDPWFDRSGDRWQSLEHGGDGGSDEIACLLRHTPPTAFESPVDWARATRDYQAMVVRFHVETARRLKYTPIGLIAPDVLCDPTGGISPALLGPDGAPKEAFTALAGALRPVLPIADRLPPHLHGNEALAIDLHIANDGREPVVDATLVATFSWTGGEQRFVFTGPIAADTVQRIDTLQIVVPERTGPLGLTLELRHGGVVVTNSYRSDIYADPHEH